MQLVLGCRPDDAPSDIRAVAMKQLQKAGPMIAGGADKFTGEYHAGFLHEWHDLREVYGENYERLVKLKERFDPKDRFNKGVDFAKGRVTKGATV